MNPAVDDAKRDRTFWRGMYLIAFVIGVVVPIASIIAAGAVTAETGWRNHYDYVLVPESEVSRRANIEWRHEDSYTFDTSGGQVRQSIRRPFERRQRVIEGPLLLLGLAWSGATLIGIAGVAAAAWIVMSTGERLGIDRGRGYLRGMFFMALATGALVPLAAIIASGAISADMPSEVSDAGTALLVVMWCGMIAVCIAGLFSAAWLVKTAATKLRPASSPEPLIGMQEPGYVSDVQSVR